MWIGVSAATHPYSTIPCLPPSPKWQSQLIVDWNLYKWIRKEPFSPSGFSSRVSCPRDKNWLASHTQLQSSLQHRSSLLSVALSAGERRPALCRWYFWPQCTLSGSFFKTLTSLRHLALHTVTWKYWPLTVPKLFRLDHSQQEQSSHNSRVLCIHGSPGDTSAFKAGFTLKPAHPLCSSLHSRLHQHPTMLDLFICLLEGGPPKVKGYDLCQKWILIWKARENKPSLFFFFVQCTNKTKQSKETKNKETSWVSYKRDCPRKL